ncbi:HEPN domain-containing protein [Pseudomonas syringae pv. atrofaciens]|uniref:HEPN domain-containing protein n=1 Tax=Pseudomonas sp. FEN TaxID=2767468 RepID=UPI00174E12BC|nr:HEPN domain-containing protein [Pseudomonas sp. FEN]
MSQAVASFQANQEDIEQLWTIHEDYAGQGPGRKYGVEVLNRSVIVFVTACWESYIEDLATEAFDFLLANVDSADRIPLKIRNYSVKGLVEQKNPELLWQLSDDGWRAVLEAHKGEVLDKWVGTLNTPKTPQVNKLYEELIGIPQISSCWRWEKMSATRAADKLDEYITIRGNIAHRIRDKDAVKKSVGFQYLNHVIQIVYRTEKTVADYLERETGLRPW